MLFVKFFTTTPAKVAEWVTRGIRSFFPYPDKVKVEPTWTATHCPMEWVRSSAHNYAVIGADQYVPMDHILAMAGRFARDQEDALARVLVMQIDLYGYVKLYHLDGTDFEITKSDEQIAFTQYVKGLANAGSHDKINNGGPA